MLSKMLLLFSILVFSPISFGQSVCMESFNAEAHECTPLGDELSKICQEKHGEDFFAYLETNDCSLERAYKLRGEELPAAYSGKIVEAVCLNHDVSYQNNCQYWDFKPAKEYCSTFYGARYRPYQIDNKCTVDLADKSFGYTDSSKLIEDFNSKFAEANAILTMIDRHGMRDSLGGLISFRPVIGNEFYTDIMKGLLEKLSIIRDELELRSQLKFKFIGEDVKQFVHYGLKYMELVNRVHKVYAYVAHRNHDELSTYSFSKLNFLNLKLKKAFALEILAKVNYAVKHLDNDMVLFVTSEYDKQTNEYFAIAEPTNKQDYAKLINFLGIRTTMTNLWAVDKYFEEDLLKGRVNSCGSFLSTRKKRYSKFSEMPIIKESQKYDLFYNEYLKMENDIIEKANEVSLLDEDVFFPLLKKIYESEEVKRLLQLVMEESGDELEDIILNDIGNALIAEQEDWKGFSLAHFRTFIFPEDGVTNPSAIVERILDIAYERRQKAIIGNILGLNYFISEKESLSIEEKLKTALYVNSMDTFKIRLRRKLMPLFDNYNNTKEKAVASYEKKVEETFEIAKKYGEIARTAHILLHEKRGVQGFAPRNFEELMGYFEYKLSTEFYDIKMTLDKDEKLAKSLTEFFGKVAEKFNEKHLELQPNGTMKELGIPEERSIALWQNLISEAGEYYKDGNFEVSELALVPEPVMLARDRDSLARNPYTLEVYRDGTPVTMHINEFYKVFQEDTGVQIPHRDIVMRTGYLMGLKPLLELGKRNNKDIQTDGTFGRPYSYIAADGTVKPKHGYGNIDYAAFKRLYLQSMDLTKKEIGDSLKVKKELEELQREYEADMAEDFDIIKSESKLFARVFELFKIPMAQVYKKNTNGTFTLSYNDQKELVKTIINKAYGASTLLRKKIETKVQKEEWIVPIKDHMSPYKMKVTKTLSEPLLLKIGRHAYIGGEDRIDEDKSKGFIHQTLLQVKDNIPGKLDAFCKSTYKNYKTSKDFRKVFNYSSYMRKQLQSPVGTTPFIAKKIGDLDEAIRKDIRTGTEAFTEDFIEPSMLVFGGIALVAIAFMLTVGSLGTAAPASLAAISGYVGLVLSVTNYVMFPLIITMTFTKINSEFIEVPAHLKFQESLAHSQLEGEEITNYEEIDEINKENNFNRVLTIGLMPLDIWFGYSIGASIKSGLGITGKQTFKKMTGQSLARFSSPPKSHAVRASFRGLWKEQGLIKAAVTKTKMGVTNVKAMLPKYRNIPEELLKTGALRIAIVRQFEKLKIHNKPWEILDELKGFKDKYHSRTVRYGKYVSEEGKQLDKFMAAKGKGLRFTEIFQDGIYYTKFGFTVTRIFQNLRPSKMYNFIRNYGKEIDDLKKLQGEIFRSKEEALTKLIQKVDSIRRLNAPARGANYTEDMLRLLSDEEIMLLQQIAKKSKGHLYTLKPIFKMNERLVQSLRSTEFLYGQVGIRFQEHPYYQEALLADATTPNKVFAADSQRLVEFYETMMRQSYRKSETINELRRSIEERLSKLFTVDQNGVRTYL